MPVLLALVVSDSDGAGRGHRAHWPTRRHPIHVSRTQVDLSRDERTLEVTIRTFTDDLEAALRSINWPVSIEKGPAGQVDSALSAYLRDRVQVGLDGRTAVSGRVVGHQREEDATVVSVAIPLASVPTRVRVTQRVLLERFDDQTNLLHLRIGTMRRSALLRRGIESAEFTLTR